MSRVLSILLDDHLSGIGRGDLDDEVLRLDEVALGVEVDRAGDALVVLERAHGGRYVGPGGDLVAGR